MEGLVQSDYRDKYNEYRNDVVIQQYSEIIKEILLTATPIVTINFSSGERNMDIDKSSKDKIALWKQELDNYIQKKYSDILCRQGKTEGQQ